MPIKVVDPFFGAIFPWIAFAALVSLLASAFRFFILPTLKGRLGEASVNLRARRDLPSGVYHLIPDVMLPALRQRDGAAVKALRRRQVLGLPEVSRMQGRRTGVNLSPRLLAVCTWLAYRLLNKV